MTIAGILGSPKRQVDFRSTGRSIDVEDSRVHLPHRDKRLVQIMCESVGVDDLRFYRPPVQSDLSNQEEVKEALKAVEKDRIKDPKEGRIKEPKESLLKKIGGALKG